MYAVKQLVQIKTEFYDNGEVACRSFYEDGTDCLSRYTEDGPAYETFFPNGNKQSVVFIINGLVHRTTERGPARQEWFENGQLKCEQYLYNDKFHRDPKVGPAIIHYKENGEVEKSEFYNHGCRLSDTEVQDILKPDPMIGETIVIGGKEYILCEKK
jgi:antitoxin component YwqK of YwqJK toxin-antitoxin module